MLEIEVYSPTRLFAQCLVASLNQCDQFEARDSASSIDALLEKLEENTPDVLLVDVATSGVARGIATVSDLWSDLAVLAIAVPDDPVEVIACAEAGFTSFLPRTASIEAARDAILAASRDEVICSGRVASTLMREIYRRPKPTLINSIKACLTPRERQVVALLAEDRSNKEIACMLCISVATVKNHVHNILGKLGAGHRRAAVACIQANPGLMRAGPSVRSAEAERHPATTWHRT